MAKTKAQLIAELAEMHQQRSVEKAAERIREEAMAMRSSEDLYPLAATFLTEVRNLGINTWYLSIALIEDEEIVYFYRALVNWSSMGLKLKEDSDPVIRVLNDEAIIHVFPGDSVPVEVMGEKIREAKIRTYQTNQVGYFEVNDKDDPEGKRRLLLRHWTGAESDVQRVLESMGQDQYYYQVSFSHGVVSFSDPSDSKENIETVKNLAESFSLGYLRFLDFQKLEQQTEQARRESAVERVRAEAMAMKSSDELLNVVAILWRQLLALGVETEGCNIDFIDEETGYMHRYYTFYANKMPRAWKNRRQIDPDTEGLYHIETIDEWSKQSRDRFGVDAIEHWRKGETYSYKAESDWSHYPGTWIVTYVHFRFGFIAIREKTHSTEHIELVKKLARALELGYLRFLDFQHLEEQNREIQENTRRKSDFLARMSHDLRTPMNAIIGYTRLLLRKAQDKLDERQLRNLENIDTSAHNLLNLINEILDLSRVEAGRIEVQPQPVDFQQLATECVAAIEPLIQAEVQLIQNIEAVPTLRTDGEILRKVLMNLLGNAVKFTDAGSITVSVKSVEDQVEISVADTGMGIPSEDLPYIFEEFRQVERQGSTEKEGTGLGLAIARKSVELLGGTIIAESEVDKGATFTLRIKDYPSE